MEIVIKCIKLETLNYYISVSIRKKCRHMIKVEHLHGKLCSTLEMIGLLTRALKLVIAPILDCVCYKDFVAGTQIPNCFWLHLGTEKFLLEHLLYDGYSLLLEQ